MEDAGPATILEELRHSTRSAHERLESNLDLLSLPADRDFFIAVLKGFLGFHLVFEPALARHPELSCFMSERSRVAPLTADLRSLAGNDFRSDLVPLCHEAETCCSSLPQAWGALYVIEGSTLGGQVITRSLDGTAWLPAGGLQTFHPYGPRTGRMWNDFRARLVTATTSLDTPQIVAGAVQTFSLLADWLPTRWMNVRNQA